MAGNDPFDAQEWGPDFANFLPPSPDQSPEPVAIRPQPVAYTTVGSVVNPRSTLQLTAPNRIQREGAHVRKSLLSMVQMHDTATNNNQARGPPPSLNMANNMQYAQQLGRNTPQPANVLQSITNTNTDRTRPSLAQFVEANRTISDDDIQTLLFSLGHSNNNENQPPMTHTFSTMSEEELAARSANNQSGPIQGLHKMQTLQRLAKYPNPVQKHALETLAALAVKAQPASRAPAVPDMGGLNIADRGTMSIPMTSKAITHPGMPKPGARLGDIAAAKIMQNIEAAGGFAAYLAPHNGGLPEQRAPTYDSRFRGELDRAYQFPPSSSQANPLYGAYGSSRQGNPPLSRPPGYPQPLTAGPPGQRQFPPAASYVSSIAATEDPYPAEFQANNYNPLQNDSSWDHPTNSQSGNSFTAAGQSFPTVPEAVSKPGFDYGAPRQIVDTLSMADAYKYFPNGFPANMTGHWTSPKEEDLRRFGGLPPLTAEEKEARKIAASDDRYYHHYRRLASMTPKDYEVEHDARQVNPYGPIAPPPRVELQKRTVEEYNNMTPAEEAAALKPILNAAYGSLLGYLDRAPGSRSSMSKWGEAGEELLDRTKEGNKSYFGEDWGAPPSRMSSSSTADSQTAPRATRGQTIPNPFSASQMLAAKHMQQR